MLLLLVACQDYTLDGEKGAGIGFDSGEAPPDTAVDTGETGGDSEPTSDACALDIPVAGEAAESVSCGNPPVVDPWNVVLRDKWLGLEPGYFYMSEQVATGNLNDDNGDGRVDQDDISDIVLAMAHDVCVSDETELIALSGADLAPLWNVTYPWLDLHTAPALGDVDGDGAPDIVMQTDMGTTVMFDAQGNARWESTTLYQYNLPGPSLADLDGDGTAEVLISEAVIDGASGVIDTVLTGTYASASVGSDLDLDGHPETLFGGSSYDSAGAKLATVTSAGVYPAVLDLDGDPTTGEVAWAAGTQLVVGDDARSGAWAWSGMGALAPPTVADLDGDGVAELAATMEEDTVLAWDKAGNLLWQRRVDFVGHPAMSAADLDRDGRYELLLAGEKSWVILGGDGAILYTSPTYDFTSTPAFSTSPIVTDLDGDGSAEVIQVIEEGIGTQWSSQLLIWSHANQAWPPTAHSWSQFSFTPQARNDDGTVPATLAPSWVGAELFRGWPSDAGGRADLRTTIADVCAAACDADSAVGVSVQVTNVGTVDAPAGTPVTLYADDGTALRRLATLPLPAVLPAGRSSDGLVFDTTVADLGLVALVVTADDDGAGLGRVDECDEADNSGTWAELPCR